MEGQQVEYWPKRASDLRPGECILHGKDWRFITHNTPLGNGTRSIWLTPDPNGWIRDDGILAVPEFWFKVRVDSYVF